MITMKFSKLKTMEVEVRALFNFTLFETRKRCVSNYTSFTISFVLQ